MPLGGRVLGHPFLLHLALLRRPVPLLEVKELRGLTAWVRNGLFDMGDSYLLRTNNGNIILWLIST